jgi:predicted component of type VI protein secretion system
MSSASVSTRHVTLSSFGFLAAFLLRDMVTSTWKKVIGVDENAKWTHILLSQLVLFSLVMITIVLITMFWGDDTV